MKQKIKLRPMSEVPSDSYFFGMGRWTRANPEVVLLATRGKPKRIDAGVKQLVVEKIEKHSKKPAIVRDKIVQLCGDLPRIELFAREVTEGWTCLGNEINGKDIKEELEELWNQK